ncbi:hypothetical protein [Endozoicomonas sp. GU-1]|uniref:hypothetical protein n=1 Tax=Endozoicomonas sp. GU-1 TaxID=3009078 RepID=UPI0022B51AAC|nr:hypothetical protein [Endozoicomonas sp. GU-1]WBA81232.1 hypothetical protein O2T12_23545 [Endozoicomonas sp. GU-1]
MFTLRSFLGKYFVIEGISTLNFNFCAAYRLPRNTTGVDKSRVVDQLVIGKFRVFDSDFILHFTSHQASASVTITIRIFPFVTSRDDSAIVNRIIVQGSGSYGLSG